MPLLTRLIRAALLIVIGATVLQYLRLQVRGPNGHRPLDAVQAPSYSVDHDGVRILESGSIMEGSVNNDNDAQSKRPVTDGGGAVIEHLQQEEEEDDDDATCFHLSDPPFENYFYSDSHVHSHVVVTSPLSGSGSTSLIKPRLLVAWPSGNSGVCAYFQPLDDSDATGPLKIELQKSSESSSGFPVGPVYIPQDHGLDVVGVRGVIHLSSPAVLSVAILGSIRTIRDYVEGPSILVPEIQGALEYSEQKSAGDHGASISRTWLDDVTRTTLSFKPTMQQDDASSSNGEVIVDKARRVLIFASAGDYEFSACYNYPQLKQLKINNVLKPEALRSSILLPHQASSSATKSLSFLSYTSKLLAGSWKFLTYFGRDSLLSALLMEPILSSSAIEAVLGAVLERINRLDGRACHEEIIGDYATWLNFKETGQKSTAARCDYNMIDTEYFIPILLERYLLRPDDTRQRQKAFLATPAGAVETNNRGLTWGDLAITVAAKIINDTAAFAAPGGQTVGNMIHLKKGYPVGNWRDSNAGLGIGRVPFDVNTALVPAALRAIANLGRELGEDVWGAEAGRWVEVAEQNAKVWEDEALSSFEIMVPASDARQELKDFVKTCDYYDGPSQAEAIEEDVTYYAVALDDPSSPSSSDHSNDHNRRIPILHSDTSFRLFLQVDSTNRSQELKFLNATALSVIRPFPAGLSTPVGMLVANPAYASKNLWLRQNFGHSAYHGAVVWGWQLAMMVKGLENRLVQWTRARLSGSGKGDAETAEGDDEERVVYDNVRKAYNVLWDVIEANKEHLSDEVWSWRYQKETGGGGTFKYAQLGSLPPPPGASASVESNAMQLWSLTFLALRRDERWR